METEDFRCPLSVFAPERRHNVTVNSGKMSVLGHSNLDCRQTSFGFIND
jgi:hypothetical protein